MGFTSYESARASNATPVILVALYLAAIVTANWLVSQFGPSVSVWTAFGFIGLNLTTRDYLHDAWHGPHLRRNMVLLIASGSLLSIPFNAGRIAAASFAAFAVSETVDALIYQRLIECEWWQRINGSNLGSALVDSIAFPALAFGFPLLYGVMAGQFLAKTVGGFIWSIVLSIAQSA